MDTCELREFCTLSAQYGKLRLARRGIHPEYLLLAIQDVVADEVDYRFGHGGACCLNDIFQNDSNFEKYKKFWEKVYWRNYDLVTKTAGLPSSNNARRPKGWQSQRFSNTTGHPASIVPWIPEEDVSRLLIETKVNVSAFIMEISQLLRLGSDDGRIQRGYLGIFIMKLFGKNTQIIFLYLRINKGWNTSQ